MVLGIDSSASKGDTEGKNLTDIQGDVSKNMGAVCGAAFQNTNISTLVNDGMKQMKAAMDKINGLCDATCIKNLMLQHLDKEYKVAQYTYDNAPLNMYIAQQNYVVNANGEQAYDELLKNRYEKNATIEINKLKGENKLINERFNDYYSILYNQNMGGDNMRLLLKNLKKENKELLDIINGSEYDIHTYHRKSSYESMQRDSLNIWIGIATLVYWTLLIVWIAIVIIYLRNFGLWFAIIMTLLIAYPFFATSIYMYIIRIIGDIIKVVFLNIKRYAQK